MREVEKESNRKFFKDNRTGKRMLRAAFLMLFALGFLYYENNALEVSDFNVESLNIPAEFEGYKILQISDLQSKSFGRGQEKLIECIRSQEPDIIVLTGDLVDYKDKELESTKIFLEGIRKIAPIYFITGNHEEASEDSAILMELLEEYGIIVLDGESIILKRGEGEILLSGISDMKQFYGQYSRPGATFRETLQALSGDGEIGKKEGTYRILLSHRPELIDNYAEAKFDLVFSGHAHGGQVRLPFIGGLIAPGQGFFPKYTEGIYVTNKTSMVVSRGLGSSSIPQRLFNHPEIVVVTLSVANHK